MRQKEFDTAHRVAHVLWVPELDALLAEGRLTLVGQSTAWVDASGKPSVVVRVPARAEVQRRASELGIEVDDSWSMARLSEEISEAQAKLDVETVVVGSGHAGKDASPGEVREESELHEGSLRT